MSATAAELLAVSKAYGRRTVVDGVSFILAAGQRVALLGHNGAGKTTIMKMMLGLTPPSTGRLAVLGRPPGSNQTVGFLPEAVGFHQAMTGRETLAFYAALKHRPPAEAGALLERVGLAEAAGRRVATYSKGMRQRLGLAQALLGQPRLLLLDEPTTGLDPELRRAFYDIVAERAGAGAAVLLSSHLLTELEARTDMILIMDRGRLVAAGSMAELRARSGLPVRLSVLAEEGQGGAVAAALGELVGGRDGDRLELACPPAAKMAVLARLAGLPVADLEMRAPGLDELYAHLLGGTA